MTYKIISYLLKATLLGFKTTKLPIKATLLGLKTTLLGIKAMPDKEINHF